MELVSILCHHVEVMRAAYVELAVGLHPNMNVLALIQVIFLSHNVVSYLVLVQLSNALQLE